MGKIDVALGMCQDCGLLVKVASLGMSLIVEVTVLAANLDEWASTLKARLLSPIHSLYM